MTSENPNVKPNRVNMKLRKYPQETRDMIQFFWEKTNVPESQIVLWTGINAGLIHSWRTKGKWNGSHRRQNTQNDPLETLRNELKLLQDENNRLRLELAKHGQDPDDIENIMAEMRKQMVKLVPISLKMSDLATAHRELRETVQKKPTTAEDGVNMYLPETTEEYSAPEEEIDNPCE